MYSDITSALRALRSGDTTALALADHFLSTSEASQAQAALRLTPHRARERAAQIDARGDYSAPLAGIPVGIKDVICTEGIETTAASRILEGYVPPYSATVWIRLEEAGAVLVSKLNCDEFAMGSSTEQSGYQITRNPRDLSRVPGGSSGGSAAAVAGEECLFSLGTDTGGSIRQPAHFCGCVGLKPTYGRVSRSGVIAYGSSFDTVGPLTHSVEDAARVLQVIAGADPADGTTAPIPVPDYLSELSLPVDGTVIGVPVFPDLSPEMQSLVDEGVERLHRAGVETRAVELPLMEAVVPTYYLLAKAEASSNVSRYDGIRYGQRRGEEEHNLETLYKATRGELFGPEVKRAIMMGGFTLSSGAIDAYYRKAAQVRTLLLEGYRELFQSVQGLLMPVAPSVAWKIGEGPTDPHEMYLTDIFTVSANLVGSPSLSVPIGEREGMPAGLQVMMPQWEESLMLRVGRALEQSS